MSERFLDCEPANNGLESIEGREDVVPPSSSNGAVNPLSSPLKTSVAISFDGMDVSTDKDIFARPKTSDDYPVQQASTVRPFIDGHRRSSQKEPYASKTEAGQDRAKENEDPETGSKVSRPLPSGSGSLFSLYRPSFSPQRSPGAGHKHRRMRSSNMSEEPSPCPKLTQRRINSDESSPSPILIHSRINSEGGVVRINQKAGANFSPYRLYPQRQHGCKDEFCPPPSHPTSKLKEDSLRQDEVSDIGRKHHHHHHHNQHHQENSSGLSLKILTTAANADTTNGKSAKVGEGSPATPVAPTMTKPAATLAQTRSPLVQVKQQQQAYPKTSTPRLWQRSPPSFSAFQFSPASFSTLGSSSPTCQHQQGQVIQGGQQAYSTGSRMKQAHLAPRHHQQKSQLLTPMAQLTPQREQGDYVPHSRPHFHRIPSTQDIAGFIGGQMQPPPPTPHQLPPQYYPPHTSSLQYYHHHHHQGQAHRHHHHHHQGALTHCYYPPPQSSALTHYPATRNSPSYPVQYAPAQPSSFFYGDRKEAGISNASPEATALERRPSTPSQKQLQRLSCHNRNPVQVSAASQKSSSRQTGYSSPRARRGKIKEGAEGAYPSWDPFRYKMYRVPLLRGWRI